MRCIPPARSIPVGSRAPVPPSPSDSAARPSHQRPSALPFPHTLLQQHGGSAGRSQRGWTSRRGASEPPWPPALVPPFPGMCRSPTAGAPRSRLPDVLSQLGFVTCSAKCSQQPCASLSPQLPPRLLHNSIFRAGATCSASAGSGVLLPSSALQRPSFYCSLPSA